MGCLFPYRIHAVSLISLLLLPISLCTTHCGVGIRELLIRQNTNNSMTLAYRILLRNEPEGGYTVMVPSLPGCVTFGGSMEEAIITAKEAIELYIESLRAHEEKIPTEENTLEYTVMVETQV